MTKNNKGKVTLISVDKYGPSMGVRFLSAVLKQAGYETVVIFVVGAVTRDIAMGQAAALSDKVHQEIATLAKESLYIGVSTFTATYHKAKEITEQLKTRLDIPVIWGGVHAIVKPEECLKTADMICTGEGEELVVNLAERLQKNQPYHDLPGLRLPNQPSVNRSQPFVDITDLPKPDYVLEGSHYMATPQEIQIVDTDSYIDIMLGAPDYYLAPTRGCPYKCTYCINNKYASLYKESRTLHQTGAIKEKNIKRFRQRHLDGVIDELIWAKKNLPIKRVIIDDDCFMAVTENDIRAFAQAYKAHIGIPFVLRGAHPQNVTEEKLRLLCDAGLIKLRVGIQTGSERIRKLYDRVWETNTKILEMAHLINQFIKKGQLRYIMYDVIVDNPWETEQDRIDTLNLVFSLPKPFGLYCFSLTFYPGTALYERALSEQLITAETTEEAYWESYKVLEPIPSNKVLELIRDFPLPLVVMKWLAKRGFIANTTRDFCQTLVEQFPELSLFYRTRLRYEVDFRLTYLKKEEIKEFISLYLKLQRATVPLHLLEKEQVTLPTWLFKQVLINLYLWFLAPKTTYFARIHR